MRVSPSSPFMTIVLFLTSTHHAWELPTKEFLVTFTQTFQKEGVLLYLPDKTSRRWEVVSMMKHLR